METYITRLQDTKECETLSLCKKTCIILKVRLVAYILMSESFLSTLTAQKQAVPLHRYGCLSYQCLMGSSAEKNHLRFDLIRICGLLFGFLVELLLHSVNSSGFHCIKIPDTVQHWKVCDIILQADRNIIIPDKKFLLI